MVKQGEPFLYAFQWAAVNKGFNGCIFNGGTGSGKSRTGLFYYFKEQGGWIDGTGYTYMRNPKDLYIITPAAKRDKLEWEHELAFFLMSTKPEESVYDHKIVVDSWNNIKKYTDVKDAFFIFDEQRVTGNGTWVKSFLHIAKHNNWIMLSATPGDKWEDYIPVFLANGFYRNKTEFIREHIVYSRYSNFPKVDRYVGTGKLLRLRNKILIDMDFERNTIQHHEDVRCSFDVAKYKDVMKNRWDPYKDEPIEQAASLCFVLRRIVNEDESRQVALLNLLENHPKAIIFYSFDYELDILKNLAYPEGTVIAEWNGHVHQDIPTSEKWVYLVNYGSAEAWNCITTDTIIFYSQQYSYKVKTQAVGRIDRMNTTYKELYYYHLKSRAGIDLSISRALDNKKSFNENKWFEKILKKEEK